MSHRISRRTGAMALVAMAGLLGTLLIAVPAAPAATIYACQKKKGGTIRIVSSKTKCKKSSEKKIKWSTTGPAARTNGTQRRERRQRHERHQRGARDEASGRVVSNPAGCRRTPTPRSTGSASSSVTEDVGVARRSSTRTSTGARWPARQPQQRPTRRRTEATPAPGAQRHAVAPRRASRHASDRVGIA